MLFSIPTYVLYSQEEPFDTPVYAKSFDAATQSLSRTRSGNDRATQDEPGESQEVSEKDPDKTLEDEEASEESEEEDSKLEPGVHEFTFKIPHFAEFVLRGSIDTEAQTFDLKGSLKEQKTLQLGGLKLESPVVTLSRESGLRITSEAQLFDKKATLALERFIPGEDVLFSLSLEKPFTVPVSPWKKVNFQKLYLSIGPGAKKLFTRISLIDPEKEDVMLTIGLEDDEQFMGLDIEDVRLSSILKKDDKAPDKTPFDAITLAMGQLRVFNIFKKDEPVRTQIEAEVDLSEMNLDVPGDLSQLYLAGTIEKDGESELSIEFDADIPLVPKFFTITDPFLKITREEQEEDEKLHTLIALGGDVSVKLPNPVGEIGAQLKAELKDGKFQTFEGELKKTFNFKDIIKIDDASLRYSRENNSVAIVGSSTVLDQIDIEARLETYKPKEGPNKGKRIFQFVGSAVAGEMIKPFDNVPGLGSMPIAKDLAIGDLEFRLDSKSNLQISGKTKISGFEAEAKLIKTKDAVVVKAQPSEQWSLADSVSMIKGTPFENIDFSGMSLAFASGNYQDIETGMKIPAGMSFLATTDLSAGIFKGAKMFLRGAPDELTVAGSFSKKGIGLTIAIPTRVKLSKSATLENIFLLVNYEKPAKLSMSIKSQLRAQLPKQKEDTLFTAKFELEVDPKAPSVEIVATMEGMWEDPLGINGLAIGDVAFEMGAALLPAPPFIRPSGVGFTGRLNLGSKKVRIATKLSDDGDNVLLGEINAFDIADLFVWWLEVASVAGVKIPKGPLEDISFKDVKLKVATMDTTIGEIPFEQGITLQGKIKIFNKYAMVDINVDTSGIEAAATVSQIKLGEFLNITGAGMDEKYGTPDDGPTFKLALNADKQELFMSGLMELLGSKDQTEVRIGSKGIKFMTLKKMFGGRIKTKLTGISSGSGKGIDFRIKGEFENDFFDYVERQIIKGMEKFKDAAKRDLTKAQNDVDKINKDIAKLDRHIRERKDKIDKNKKTLARKNKEAKKDVAGARAKVKGEENKIRSLDKKIRELKKKLTAQLADPAYKSLLYTSLVHDRLYIDTLDTGLSYFNTAHDLQKACVSQDIYSQEDLFSEIQSFKHDLELYYDVLAMQHENPLLAWGFFRSIGRAFKKAGQTIGKGFAVAGKAVAKGVVYVGKKTGYAAQIAALETAKGVALGALKAAQGILRAAEEMAFDPATIKEAAFITKDGTELAGLETAKATLIASRETAKGILEGLKQTSIGLAEAGKFVAKVGARVFNVKRATIDMSVNAFFTKGLLPKFTLDAVVLGRKLNNIELQFDFKRPDKFFVELAKIVGKFFKP